MPECEGLESKVLLGKAAHGIAVLELPATQTRLLKIGQLQSSATAARPYHVAGAVTGVTDPTIIKQGNTYYLFSTGPGIAIRASTDLIHWQRMGQVFPSVPDWASSIVPGATEFWAPAVAFFDGEYHLYYAMSTFGSNRSVIGLATNATLDPSASDYQWVDQGKVIASTPGKTDWNAIDPSPIVVSKTSVYLAFGSQWSGIKLAAINPQTGKLLPTSARSGSSPHVELYSLASRPDAAPIEAPFIFYRDGYYYLFASFNDCCIGAASTYEIAVGRSRSVTGPYRDRAGKLMTLGGGSVVLKGAGTIRGPGSNAVLADDGQDWIIYQYYDARAGGIAKLGIQPLDWTSGGWAVAAAPPG
jgi:arabinan endo-1,5-alpha-L-arabinosidase